MITRQQIRSVLAEGARLLDSGGRLMGTVTDVVLDFRTSQPAWATVDGPLCGGIVPLTRAHLLDACLQVPYSTADVCGAPRGKVADGGLDRQHEEQLRRYYAALDDAPPVWPAPMGQAMPPVSTNGHRPANSVPAGSRLAPCPLPVVAGLDVHTGDDDVAAYPPTPSGPWPPVATSSPGPPWWQRRQWRWPSVLTSVREMRLELRPVLDLTGLPDDELDDLVLAAGEAAANAVEHAGLVALPVFDVLVEVGQHRARIVIQDHGRWRPPAAGGPRGRGLQMIGVLADATLTVGPRGTTVVLCNHARPRGDRTAASAAGRAP